MSAANTALAEPLVTGGRPRNRTRPGRIRTLLPGIAASGAVGAAAYLIGARTPAMSPLIWAILIGAGIANTAKIPATLLPGIAFSAKNVLRLAVGLLGIRLGLAQVAEVGVKGIGVVLVAVAATFGTTVWLSRRFGLSKKLGTIIASGTSICGAAAVVAVAGVIDAKEEETAVGVGTVTALGTVAMLVYPLVGHALDLSADAFGLWAGSSIHEVAQVVAAGFSFDGGSAVETATIVKLGRVLTLAPIAVMLSLAFRRQRAAGAAKVSPVPWFIALFVLMVAVRSLDVLPDASVAALVTADTMLLTVAMAGLGLDLRWSRIRAAGVKPLYVATLASVFMAVLTFALVRLLGV